MSEFLLGLPLDIQHGKLIPSNNKSNHSLTPIQYLANISLTLSPRGSELSGFYGGADSVPPMENPFMGCFCQFLNQAKLIYNYRSHAKGDSQNFKIEEVEEL